MSNAPISDTDTPLIVRPGPDAEIGGPPTATEQALMDNLTDPDAWVVLDRQLPRHPAGSLSRTGRDMGGTHDWASQQARDLRRRLRHFVPGAWLDFKPYTTEDGKFTMAHLWDDNDPEHPNPWVDAL